MRGGGGAGREYSFLVCLLVCLLVSYFHVGSSGGSSKGGEWGWREIFVVERVREKLRKEGKKGIKKY